MCVLLGDKKTDCVVFYVNKEILMPLNNEHRVMLVETIFQKKNCKMTSSVIPYIVDGNALCDIMTASYFFLELLIKESVEIKGSNCNFFH